MKRIFGSYAYGNGPREACWWSETVSPLNLPSLEADVKADVAIVGGGYTGMSAALHLAEAGADVVLLEANDIGWGASGRNGGFCCLGGGIASDAMLDQRFGVEDRRAWRQTEVRAVTRVAERIARYGMDVERHSEGETLLAHNVTAAHRFEEEARRIEENYHVSPRLHDQAELRQDGLHCGAAAGLTIPIGFALNPARYIDGLTRAAQRAGARIFVQSPVARIENGTCQIARGPRVRAERVIVATNGYSSEDLPPWLAGRYMPVQSNILVTRPLEDTELQAQGWTSRQMAYDSRNLLHYFRLLPDRRFLFGLRGGLISSPQADKRAQRRARADFEQMFPAWRHVETNYAWSGLVSLARDLMPFVGPAPDDPTVFLGLCYHGNGVAMASYAGECLANLANGAQKQPLPRAMRTPLSRFPLGGWRRAIMPAAYAGLWLADRLGR